MCYRICVVTGTRADYGLLRELLIKLQNNKVFELELVVTGSHLSESFGNTQDEIVRDGFEKYVKIEIPLEDDSKSGMAISAGVALIKFSEYFKDNTPDLVIILGDRFEILAVAIAAQFLGIPIAHISGGDVTEGAVDDAIRHCITKMSTIHFPGCEQSEKRIIQMGEHPEMVHNVGEPGVENVLKMKLISRDKLVADIGFNGLLGDYGIVTFHPVTRENDTGDKQVYELIAAMDEFPELFYVITMANADAGGRNINDIWIEEGKKRSNWLVVPSLGVLRYLSVMKYSKMVIGNSSSGIVEAPSMGIPTINIGDRQKGRMMAESIVSCDADRRCIIDAFKTVLGQDFQYKAKKVKSPFGDGTTSDKIISIVEKYLSSNVKTTKKVFFDLNM